MINAATLIACGGCTTRWSGTSKAHCSSCHRTFGGITGFDKHRNRDKCLDPSEVGLMLNEDGVWIRSDFREED